MTASFANRSDRRLGLRGAGTRGDPVIVTVGGESESAHLGETVAAVLMAAGQRSFRTTARRGAPRGLYCGMGVCYDCLVVVDGRPNVRACMTYVRDQMVVDFQEGWRARQHAEDDR